MPENRPYLTYSLNELKAVVDATEDRAVWQRVLVELTGYRTKPKAKVYEATLRARLGTTPTAAPDSPAPPPEQPALELARERSDPRARPEHRPPRFPPTDQQREAVNAFMSGGSLKISAFAGAGKTSTLKLMANARAGRGLYLAFNSRTAEEAAGDFPDDVDCRTTHSLAARTVRSRYRFGKPKMFGKVGAIQLAAILNIQPRRLDDAVTLTPPQQAFLLLATLRRFCQGSRDSIAAEHIFTTPRLLGLARETRQSVNEWVLGGTQQLWQRMTNAADEIPLGHDGYLKLWALSRPILDYDYVLLDEAQDTNPVVLDVLGRQNTQMVYVGDRHQQIYEWRGAVNAMETIATDAEAALTQSWRFGEAIAGAASALLRTLGETRTIKGNPSRHSSIVTAGVPNAILARTNATVIKQTLAALDGGRKPHIVGGTKELKRLVGDVFSLMRGEPGSHPDFFGFKNWEEVIAFAETDEGESLRPFVTLVLAHGAGALYAAITHHEPNAAAADIAISTAHKAKGSEWNAVELAADFSANPNEEGAIGPEEFRLFYVAMTRAKECLIADPAMLEGFIGAQRTSTARPLQRAPGPSASQSLAGHDFQNGDWPAGMF